MYRLLIVDDEETIREGLRHFVDYEQYGIEVAGCAGDGREALEIIAREPIHILLTDIRMPDVDGLALLRSVRACHPDMKSVVLSGYDDFSYVREAMMAGAHTYLLKPVQRQELLDAMCDVAMQIEREAADFRYRQESLRLMKINVLNRLLMQAISAGELEEKMALLGLAARCGGGYRVVVVKPALNREIEIRKGDSRLFEALALSEEIMAPQGGHACYDTLGNIVLILPEDGPASFFARLDGLKGRLEERLSGSVGMVAGVPVDDIRAVHISYRSALSALNYIYILGTDRVIDSAETGAAVLGADGAPAFDEAGVRRLSQARDLDALTAYVDRYLDNLRAVPLPDLRLIHVRLIEMIVAVSDELSVTLSTPDSLYEIRHRTIRAIVQSGFLCDTRQIMRDGLAEMLRHGGPADAPALSRYTAEAMAIVAEQYADVGLSVKTIAGRLHVNPAYLGRTFYRDTGQYFSDYLNEYRIQKAKEMLLLPQARVQEVSERVGYVSASYFAAVFKRQTGVNPSGWRK